MVENKDKKTSKIKISCEKKDEAEMMWKRNSIWSKWVLNTSVSVSYINDKFLNWA